jgi:hypothetical protein
MHAGSSYVGVVGQLVHALVFGNDCPVHNLPLQYQYKLYIHIIYIVQCQRR